jgi:two-component system, NtrC family, response regulator AtoC
VPVSEHELQRTLLESMEDSTGGQRSRSRLLIFSGETLTTHVLPEDGALVVGRADECHIQVDTPALSRRHALLRVSPGRMTVEDMGSSNGTRVRGKLLEKGEKAELKAGDSIELGPVTLVVQRASKNQVPQRPRRLWTHAYFEGRIEEECGRAEESGVGFTVLRMRLEGTTSPSLVQEVLATVLKPTDIIASYGPGEYEALVSGKADGLEKAIKDALKDKGGQVTFGTAVWGKDGKDPDRILGEANARLSGAGAQQKTDPTGRGGIVVADPQMEALHALVQRVAQGNIAVLLLGETGVGKEIFAQALHDASARKGKAFLKLNCAAFTETLLESELFGHEKGAFTGAVKTKIGLLESATGGTVLLDEVGEMPLATQARLLRVLESKEVLRVGDVKPRPIDVRFVAATHKDLEESVQRGVFRQDLFFRLNGFSIVIPPLRERLNELEQLVRHFIARASKQYGKSPEPSLSPEALSLLKSYRWPGNLRELRNVIERAVLLCNDNTIGVEDLPTEKFSSTPLTRQSLPLASGTGGGAEFEAERGRIIAALDAHGGNQTLAARALGISRRTMLNRLDTYAIPRPRKGKG